MEVPDYRRILEERYNRIEAFLLHSSPSFDKKHLRTTFEFVCFAHEGQFYKSGKPYVMHLMDVALIVAEMNFDAESVIAALLHDILEDTCYTYKDVSQRFGETVAMLVDGVTKLTNISFVNMEDEQAEILRKMYLAMTKDIRMLIIKICDRLHYMRTIEYTEPNLRNKALETMKIYAPLAHRIGMSKLKFELEDLSFRCLDPVGYEEISSELETRLEQTEGFLEKVSREIDERIKKEGIDAQIKNRIKPIYSIHKKMVNQNKTLFEVYDLFAVRIIIKESLADCYGVLGLVHDLYEPIPGRFKDYISTPKPNSYQSLHTTVIGCEGVPFEVQIRTNEMHQAAEYGSVTHWKDRGGNGDITDRLEWMRRLLKSQQDSDTEELNINLRADMFMDKVLVFTPKGDIINLPAGSISIDLAYAIHSDIGNRMTSAVINGCITPLDYQLQNGDIIEVVSKNKNGPDRNWLKIVKTKEARKKIKQWLKKECYEENVAQGKIDFVHEMERIGIVPDSIQEVLPTVLNRMGFQSTEDMYATVGCYALTVTQVLNRLRDELVKLTKKSNNLKRRFYYELGSFNYKSAFYIFEELKNTDISCHKLFMNDLLFLFDPNKSLAVNEISWNHFEESIKYKTILWCLLTNGLNNIRNNSFFNAKKINKLDTNTLVKRTKKTEFPHIIGKNLEIGVLKILRQLFDIEDEEYERILVELRRQLSGSQFGFDIRLAYNDAFGTICNCLIECKDYSVTKIDLKEVTGKLEQLRMTGQTVNHWILISPNGKADNYLDAALQKWEDENRFAPIQKVQLWTLDNDVDELFGLVPEVYEHYYPNDRRIEPVKWDAEKRKQVSVKWKDKLALAIPLPNVWRDYLRDPSNLLTPSEQDPKVMRDYNDLYLRRVHMHCLDEAGNLLDKSAEDFIIDWIKQSDNVDSALFILGEFGDGKTFLTYSIARRLAEDYIKSPNTGIIPIRLTLRDLKKNVNTQDFLRIRLEAFGANLKSYKDIKLICTVVIILDGFDEMSTNMDSRTIESNTLRLRDSINDSFKGLKLIITSRTPIFKKFRHLLPKRIKTSEVV